MKNALSRRSFLRQASLVAGAVTVVGGFPAIVRSAEAARKLNCVLIGCGGRGASAHLDPAMKENLVAVVDPDDKRIAVVKDGLKAKGFDLDKLRAFADYRKMFEQMGKDIDVVFIATPNHHHAPPALMAMKMGKNVYCEKPLTHDIAEARRMAAFARKYKVTTQMGNQGHCEGGYRRLCEYLAAGVIGNVTETYSWTDRANGGVGPRPAYEPVPSGLHWDEWIGPAPYREFHSDLHPHEWHGWHDFGNGSIGNMGCHVLDGVFWALKIKHPTSVEAEELREGSDERYPTGSRVRWDIPAREGLPAMKVYWYEGLKLNSKESASGSLHAAKGDAQNFPPLLEEIKKKYPEEEFESSGSLYVGDKGVIYTGCYGGSMHVLPWEKMKQIPEPPKTMPRPKNIMQDFLDACRAGKTETAAGFDYGAQLTEFTLLANLAQRAGVGKKVVWNGEKMKVTNYPELNRILKTKYRKGWDV